jgi:peptidoglycan hydrolase CwlO-like protein
MQQKSDEYKQQLSNLTDEFNSREEELKKQIKAFQVILH